MALVGSRLPRGKRQPSIRYAAKLAKALWWIFLTLWVTCFLLGIGGLTGAKAISLAGGWLGIVCGVIAMYTSFAIVANSTFKRKVLPIG